MKTAIAFLACTMLVTPALADFKRAPPPPPFTDGYFECAILGHTAERDPPHPVYYHNERDGWMYSEQLFQNGRQTYSMLSDCHLMQAVGQNGVEQLPPTLSDAPSWLGKK
jgi:hypothetical protein